MKPKLTTLMTILSLAAVSAALQASGSGITVGDSQQESGGTAATAGTTGVVTTEQTAAPATPEQTPPGLVITPNQGAATTTKTVTKSQSGVTVKTSAQKRSAAAAKPAKPAPPPKPPWQMFKLNPKQTVFLDYTDANPDMVLSFFSRTSGITILKDPAFKTSLSFTSAKKVGLDDAFDILNATLELNGYTLEKKGKLLEVVKKQAAPPPAPPMPAPQPTPPPTPPANDASVLHVYHLEFANATQVARVVNEVYTQQQLEQLVQQIQSGGGQPQPQFFGGGQRPQPPKVVRASAEDYSNSVVVNAPQKNQDEVKKLIDELDKSTTTPLDSTVFKLKYIPTDQAVDAIQNVLTANAPAGRGAAKSQDDNNQGFYRFYNPFGSNRNSSSAGGQSVIGIKQTNSVIVSATRANMELVKKLIQDMDVPTDFVGTTFFVPLANAKATDVATLLNQAFTKPRNSQNDNPFFFIYSDNYDSNQSKGPVTDVDDNGKVVNIRDLTGKVNVIADPNTNGLIIVTQPSNMRLIKGIIEKIDTTAEQVMIETIIVEANLDKTTKLGVEYSFLQGKAFGQKGWSGTGTQDYGLQTSKDPLQGLKYTLSGKNLSVFVNAIQNDSRFKVLSTPKIFTSNNMPASVDVSQQVPYITAQQSATIGGIISNYDFKPVGDTLKVTPRITGAGEVSMDVTQTADDLQGFTSFNAPIINHRQAQTTVTVADGDTIVLGGIIRSTANLTDNKIPILGDLPIIGALFRSRSHETHTTELMVLMTPHIIHSAAEAQKLREMQQKQLSPESQNNIKKVLEPGGPIGNSPNKG